MGATYENTTLEGRGRIPSFSQKAGGLVSLKYRKGMSGKKKPINRPCKTVEEVDDDASDSATVPAESMESIHCSSRVRACSSTT